MPEDQSAVTAEEFDAWLSPRQAIELLNHLARHTAVSQIYDRLRYGLAKGVAATAKYRDKEAVRFAISIKQWGYCESSIFGSDLWRTGDITIKIPQDTAAYGVIHWPMALFDVRFEPSGIRALRPRPLAPSPPIEKPVQVPEPEDEDQQKGPPVAPDLLSKWYDLYRQTYSGNQDTEAKAMASAIGMFPGKSVSRERVRALRGTQKRGRKAQDER